MYRQLQHRIHAQVLVCWPVLLPIRVVEVPIELPWPRERSGRTRLGRGGAIPGAEGL
jgi:hypothetical protein